MFASEVRASRSSSVSRLLSQQGRVFALEAHSHVFQGVLRAARSGFPRNVVITAKQTLENAIKRGDTLSPRSAELLKELNKAAKLFNTSHLFQ